MKLSNYGKLYGCRSDSEDDRHEFIRLLQAEWEKHPQMDFKDFIANLCYITHGHCEIGLSQDHKLLKTLRRGGIKNMRVFGPIS